MGNLDASTGIKVLEKPLGAVDRSQGDVHPDGNPHYLLDPRNGVVVAKTIVERLSKLDAANRADYERGLAEFTRDMNARIAGWERRLAAVKGSAVVAYHKTWEYLAAWAGLRVVAYVEEKPGIPGSPKHIASVIRRIGDEKALAVISAVYNPRNECENIAKRTGVAALTLPASVGAEKEISTYAELFDVLVGRLEKVAKGAKS
jgi:zinc/manganese transport system substrate-binding protein